MESYRIFLFNFELESKLNPETSLNINFGFKYTLSQKILFNFNLFKNEIDNLIETQLVAAKQISCQFSVILM